jgi:hypothetical protein
MSLLRPLLRGGHFFESPRWHESRWWVSDMYGSPVLAVGDALQYALSLEHPECLAERAAAYAEFRCQVRLPQLLPRDERPSQDEITDRPRRTANRAAFGPFRGAHALHLTGAHGCNLRSVGAP